MAGFIPLTSAALRTSWGGHNHMLAPSPAPGASNRELGVLNESYCCPWLRVLPPIRISHKLNTPLIVQMSRIKEESISRCAFASPDNFFCSLASRHSTLVLARTRGLTWVLR